MKTLIDALYAIHVCKHYEMLCKHVTSLFKLSDYYHMCYGSEMGLNSHTGLSGGEIPEVSDFGMEDMDASSLATTPQ